MQTYYVPSRRRIPDKYEYDIDVCHLKKIHLKKDTGIRFMDGKYTYTDPEGNTWRVQQFVDEPNVMVGGECVSFAKAFDDTCSRLIRNLDVNYAKYIHLEDTGKILVVPMSMTRNVYAYRDNLGCLVYCNSFAQTPKVRRGDNVVDFEDVLLYVPRNYSLNDDKFYQYRDILPDRSQQGWAPRGQQLDE
jgi:hypothetical protein